MRLALNTSGGVKRVAALHVRTASGIVNVAKARLRTNDGAKLFFQSLASGGALAGITVSTTETTGYVNSSISKPANSGHVTVTANGGLAPYTYLWSLVSGDPIAIAYPTLATTGFYKSLAPGEMASAVFKCTVTDAAGVSADSPTVSISIENIGGSL